MYFFFPLEVRVIEQVLKTSHSVSMNLSDARLSLQRIPDGDQTQGGVLSGACEQQLLHTN